ncbi:hypothetical protein ACAZ27_00185 [Akkermansia muciniphila]|jgi:hypothetical protein|nr:hypothetical protein CXU18_00170 [Akkermansia muciniphila]PNC47900.1 hypothetical protein CXU11_10080 [Akkermansia muciniphila]PNC51781.1 hypothetical protein CXU15_04755 [Akkermansia muciniphila]DAJ78825.1 MAG TPA: hypothetical protein [Caudoviricetes sp.]
MKNYLQIIENSFFNFRELNKFYDIEYAIKELMGYIKEIKGGLFLDELLNLYPLDNVEEWISANPRKGNYGEGLGVNLPINKDEKLGALTQIFYYISTKSTCEEYINEYYSSHLVFELARSVNMLSQMWKGVKGDYESCFNAIESVEKSEATMVKRFIVTEIYEFERLIINKMKKEENKDSNMIIKNVNNSTIVTGINLNNAMNTYLDEDLNNVLSKLKTIVNASGNQEAVEYFNELESEIKENKIKPHRVKSYWASLTQVLPQIKDMTDIARMITQIFQ